MSKSLSKDVRYVNSKLLNTAGRGEASVCVCMCLVKVLQIKSVFISKFLGLP